MKLNICVLQEIQNLVELHLTAIIVPMIKPFDVIIYAKIKRQD